LINRTKKSKKGSVIMFAKSFSLSIILLSILILIENLTPSARQSLIYLG